MERTRGECRFLAWFLTVAMAAGCATVSPGPSDVDGTPAPSAAEAEDAASTPTAAHGTPAAPEAAASAGIDPGLEQVADALLPAIAVRSAGSGSEPHFDVAVNGIPATDFFMGLVEDTPYGMVVDPSVDGRISLTIKNATVHAVMEAVRDTYGYEYREIAQGFHVLPQSLQTRIFRVDYLNVSRQGGSRTRVSSGQVSEGARTSAHRTNGVELDTDVDTVSGSRVETQTHVDFWKELTRSLEAILGDGEGRSVVASPHTGVIVVHATPAELREVDAFLALAQQSLRRQVILEAKILEVGLSDSYQSGINWAALIQSGSSSAVVGQTGGGTIFDDGVSEIAGNLGDLTPGLDALPSGTTTSAFGGVFTVALAASKFSAFIELLETQGEVNTLSSPRISTVNNQRAVIKVGSDEFFVTDVSSTTVATTATTISPDITLTPFFSGIALDVTPQIGGDGDVILHIHPSVSEVVDQTKTITVFGETQTLPLAFSTIRESDSIVRARSGQVVVIGGLMQNGASDDRAGVPGLARIPLLGRLFRHQQQLSDKRELVILLRPTIVEDGTWNTQLGEMADRLGRLLPGSEQSLGLEPPEFRD